MKHLIALALIIFPVIAFSQFSEPRQRVMGSLTVTKRPGVFQQLNGQVRDFDSLMPIADASIILLKANEAVNTVDDGTFYLYAYDVSLTDTLLINSYGYFPEKRTVADFANNWMIMLGKAAKTKQPAVNTPGELQRKMVLNPITDAPVLFAGLDKTPERFTYLQLAQKMDAPVGNSLLRKINISRMRVRSLEGAQQTRFIVHVYDIDPATGGPGAELGDTVLYVKDKSSEIITIKPSTPIIIPDRSFFVAIEWLRIDYNYNMLTYPIFTTAKTAESSVSFTPYIGVSPLKTKTKNIWALNYRHEWKPYTYFEPDNTDLAISAEIEY